MYCLSQFCCLCFRDKVKLELLSRITCGSSTFVNIASVVIPEIQLSEYSHVTSVCEECVNFVTDMHTFRRKCVHNSLLLVEYIKLLSSSGEETGNTQIEISDFAKEKINVQEEKNVNAATSDQQSLNSEDVKLDDDSETKTVGSEDLDHVVSSDRTKLHCDETAISDKVLEEVECKIEVNDDFNDKYGHKEEKTNDNQLELQDDNDEGGNASLKSKICKGSLKVKVKEHTSIPNGSKKQHKCDTCGKCFASSTDLKMHIMMHTGERPYKCIICGKGYRSQRHLKRHSSTHVEIKPHKCETCSKCFTSLDKLKTHIRIHTEERPHECNICGQCFRTRGALNRHHVVHTGEKPYKCDTCGKCFCLPDRLTQHLLVHTDEKPYECNICGRKFKKPSRLRLHNVSHTGEKPYECKTCGKCFVLPTTLQNHVAVHTGEKPFGCDICGKSFVRRGGLKRHRLTHFNPELAGAPSQDETNVVIHKLTENVQV